MGQTIEGKCKCCKYCNQFNFGGNRTNYTTFCPLPAIDLETFEFVNINFVEHKDNLKYSFYSDKVLKGENPNNNTFRCFDLVLNQENNYCPNCKKYEFDFTLKFLTD